MQRINVVGMSCSGKTTLARAIAERLGVPHVELDALYWERDWTPASDETFRARVATAVARAGQPDVTLEYLLQQRDRGWQIINIVADGVSDLALKRAEYQRVFASGGIAGLIAELENQTQRLSED